MAKRTSFPTMSVGDPFVVPQVGIPEPAHLIGAITGKHYATLGDNASGPEMVSVTPPAGSGERSTMGGDGAVSMAGGGIAVVDPRPRQRASLLDQSLTAQSSADQAQYDLGRMPLKQATYGANRAVLGASSNYLNTRVDALAQKRAALGAIQAAQFDTGDQQRVAQGIAERGATDYRYRNAAVALPTDVETPTGFTGQITSPFARAKLMTHEDQLKRDEQNNSAVRDLEVQQAGFGVDRAQLGSREADLNYSESAMAGDRAKLEDTIAGAGRKRAILGAEGDELPPFQGAEKYTNPDGSQEWLTPGEADMKRFSYEQDRAAAEYPARYAQQQQQNQYRTGQEAQGGSPQYTALTPPQLLNTLPNNATIWQTQPIVMELVRRYKLKGYSEEEAAKAAFALIQQEMDTRKKTSTTLFGATPTPSTPGTPQTPASGAQPFTFKTP